jgi:hypothetical protein
MARDHRLDLGRYVRNPFDQRGHQLKKLNFNELFTSKPEGGEYPWNPSRFGSNDLMRRMKTRKVTLNPDLNHVGNSPYFEDGSRLSEGHELFEGIGRFDRETDYDFDTGRPLTAQRPEDQPDYNPMWMEAYSLSPTLNPGDRAKNRNPTYTNPDPNGFIEARAMQAATSDVEGDLSVAQLMAGDDKGGEEKETKEEEEEA